MGTRNLTIVFMDGEYRVAQYGQGDGRLDEAGTGDHGEGRAGVGVHDAVVLYKGQGPFINDLLADAFGFSGIR